jgi:type II secretory pathway pseudopilin PulG
MDYLRKKRGMTLVETVVYVAIVAIIFTVVVQTLTTIVKTYRVTLVARSLSVSGMTALERMTRDIRNAAHVDVLNSVLGSNPGKLVLVMQGTTTEFYVENGLIKLKENSVVKGSLISQNVTTANLVFKLIDTGNSLAVKIEMTLQSGTSTTLRSENFFNTVVLRNSY